MLGGFPPPRCASAASHLVNAPRLPDPATAEALLGALLNAHRAGELSELLRARPRATRWLARRSLRPLLGVTGADPQDVVADPAMVVAGLRWLATRLRPDQGLEDAVVDRAGWLDRTSWRPMLAVVCHFGLEPVPDFPDRYRRRADESPAENLCGLWAVGTSTFYRYLEKGKRQMAQRWCDGIAQPAERLSLREFAARHLARAASDTPTVGDAGWHRRQMERCLLRRDAVSALWHAQAAHDVAAFAEVLRRCRLELARDAETDALVAAWARRGLSPRESVVLLMPQADLWLARQQDERARQVLEEAVRQADLASDPMGLGTAYGALGKFHESRDKDKALACLEDSAEYLRRAHEADPHAAREEYVCALQRLAWFHVLRNDPRSRLVLDTAQQLASGEDIAAASRARLEQTWGEYWRRAGEVQRAVEHKHRALNIFERIGDTREVLSTFNNLSLFHVEQQRFDLAESYARRVVEAARTGPVDPYILTSALGNLGIALFWQQRYDEAIEQYQAGLSESLRAHLPVIANRARYNLAEAHYRKFLASGDLADERQGDVELDRFLKAPESERDALFTQAAPDLKAEILGAGGGHVHERMWPQESVAHFAEMSEIQRQRALLAIPSAPDAQVRAHLAIATAYQQIALKEHARAQALIEQYGLGTSFDAAMDALQAAHAAAGEGERQRRAQWRQEASMLLSNERIEVLLRHLAAAGHINKSGYAELLGCGPATASKHLTQLAERGLLVQTGKGPSTRYALPAS